MIQRIFSLAGFKKTVKMLFATCVRREQRQFSKQAVHGLPSQSQTGRKQWRRSIQAHAQSEGHVIPPKQCWRLKELCERDPAAPEHWREREEEI